MALLNTKLFYVNTLTRSFVGKKLRLSLNAQTFALCPRTNHCIIHHSIPQSFHWRTYRVSPSRPFAYICLRVSTSEPHHDTRRTIDLSHLIALLPHRSAGFPQQFKLTPECYFCVKKIPWWYNVFPYVFFAKTYPKLVLINM